MTTTSSKTFNCQFLVLRCDTWTAVTITHLPVMSFCFFSEEIHIICRIHHPGVEKMVEKQLWTCLFIPICSRAGRLKPYQRIQTHWSVEAGEQDSSQSIQFSLISSAHWQQKQNNKIFSSYSFTWMSVRHFGDGIISFAFILASPMFTNNNKQTQQF